MRSTWWRLSAACGVVGLMLLAVLGYGGRFARAAPTAPVPTSPSDGASVADPITLTWNVVTGATGYTVHVAANQTFTPTLVTNNTLTLPSYSVSSAALTSGQTYWWRVLATDGSGDGPWSQPRAFTYNGGEATLPAPTLFSPQDNDAVSLPISIRWNPVTGATGYEAVVAADAAFTQELAYVGRATAYAQTSMTVNSIPVALGSTVYWRARALRPSAGAWSEVRRLVITNMPAVVIPNTATVVAGTTRQFSAAPAGVTAWEATGGTITPEGLYTAGSTAGAYQVTARWAGTTSAVATVTVTPPPNLGGVIVFTTNEGGNDSIFIMNMDGSNRRTLTDVGASDQHATISPNGQKIAYSSNRTPGGDREIYCMNVDGTGVQRVTNQPGIDYDPMFSGDGSFVVYVHENSGTHMDLYRINIDGTGMLQLTSDASYECSPDVSADNRKIAYVNCTQWQSKSEIWIMDADGQNKRQLTNFGKKAWYPTFSPDGQQIVFYSDKDGNNEIYLMNVDGSNLRRVTNNDKSDTGPCFSPDGTRIVFCSNRDGNDEIYSMRLDGTDVQRLTTNTLRDYDPDCAPGYAPPPPPNPPVLTAPTNNAQNVTGDIALTWSAADNAIGYTVQIARDNLFAEQVLSHDLAGTAFTFAGAEVNTRYYWRVRSRGDTGISVWSAIWNFTTLNELPGVPTLVAPANGSTGATVPVALAWTTAYRAAGYAVQVSTDATFTTGVRTLDVPTGTGASVDNLLGSSTHYWRVRAVNAAGPGEWSAPWTFTTVPLPPPAPTLAAPPDGATGVVTPLTLSWNAAHSATRYRLQLAPDPTFTTGLIDSGTLGNITSKQIASTLLRDTVYYWRVMAGNTLGWSGWSTPWSFRTQAGPPAAPVLTAPAHGALDVPRTVTLLWGTVARATSYRVQVSRDAVFTTPTVNETTTATQWGLTDLPGSTIFYWRVKASDGAQESGWSAVFRFTTGAPLATPVLESPAQGAQGVARPVTLTWTPVTGADYYLVQVAAVPTFSPAVMAEFTTKPALEATRVEPGNTYYWRVRAFGEAGESYWSAVWTFSTLGAPGAVTLLAPAHGANQVVTPAALSWAPLPGIEQYVVEVTVNADMRLPFVRETVTGTTFAVTALTPGVQYYWRVRALRGVDYGAWSTAWRFSALPSPSAPTLQSPLDGAAGLTGSATLTWLGTPLAAGYQVQVSSAVDFAEAVPVAVSETRYLVTGLAASTPYWWRVRAVNAAGVGAWSGAWRFATLGVPEAPVILAPAAGATGVSPVARLSWRAVPWAASYEVRVFSDAARTQLVAALPTLVEPVANVTLGENTRYWWQVRATNAVGGSDWATGDFTTALFPPGGVTLLSPGNGAGELSPVTLRWSPVSGEGTRYWVQVARDPGFATLELNSDGLTVPSVAFTRGVAGVRYWWRVRSWNAAGTADWTAAWSFTIARPGTPPAPTMLSPVDGATNLPLNVLLQWTATANTSGYAIEVALDPDFKQCVARTDALRGTSVGLTRQLQLGTTYYWHVCAWNANGKGGWSPTATFATAASQ